MSGAGDNTKCCGGVDGPDLFGLTFERAIVFRLQHQHWALPIGKVAGHRPMVPGEVTDGSDHREQMSLRQLVVENVAKEGHPELLVWADIGEEGLPGPPGE